MSSDTIIRVENLGKRYSLRHLRDQRYVALRDVLVEKATGLFRRSPKGRSKIASGSVEPTARREDRRSKNASPASSSHLPSTTTSSREDFWALKDVSFEVKRGEVVGIIGRNGAGKSTLLKILSRITEPTEGKVTLRGRVASLLEVGTGFHPELTGRENIYLNGAILGMSRGEIRAKFDEIVAFAETEKFLDTPVKRYSSGMYVRLAFAVAAHLEPEILVIDEVLAVGDAEFQKKCLGKMREVAEGYGRTVLFVRHNMAAIRSLTKRCLLLERGELAAAGQSDEIISNYIASYSAARSGPVGHRRQAGKHSRIMSAKFVQSNSEEMYYRDNADIAVDITFSTDGTGGMSLDLFLVSPRGDRLALFSLSHFHGASLPRAKGVYICRLQLGSLNLASGRFTFDAVTSLTNITWDDYLEQALVLNVDCCNPSNLPWDMKESYGFGYMAWLSRTPPVILPVES